MGSSGASSARAAGPWATDRIAALAASAGTPVYGYDGAEIRRRIARVRDAFGPHVGLLYAMKANPFGPLLSALRPVVDGLDVASNGEIDAALAAGFGPAQLRLAGPGKSRAVLARAAELGVTVSVESPGELRRLVERATTGARRTPVVLRLEPRQATRGFAVPMGTAAHPFGLDTEEATEAAALVRAHGDTVDFAGVHVYGGTQCRSVRAWLRHLAEVLDLAEAIEGGGLSCREINVGGGFGVASAEAAELDVAALGPRARRMMAKFRPGPRFVVELGRYLVADAGVYVARVLETKRRPGYRVAVLDGGVHHLWAATGQLGPRPTVVAVPERSGGRTELMGPLCTPLDHLGSVRGAVQVGDLVAFVQVGAYGATLSPNRFLGHGAPREVLVE